MVLAYNHQMPSMTMELSPTCSSKHTLYTLEKYNRKKQTASAAHKQCSHCEHVLNLI
jgi:hypothetical protein